MPLCGGSKTVQRKLVLLYVYHDARDYAHAIPSSSIPADTQIIAATVLAARHRC
jgi:hypothetical protein